jgi:hypothetical protein
MMPSQFIFSGFPNCRGGRGGVGDPGLGRVSGFTAMEYPFLVYADCQISLSLSRSNLKKLSL